MSALLDFSLGGWPSAGNIDLDPDRPVLRPLLSYWQDKRADRQLPARADIDPIDIPRLLPHIGLIDVEHDPRRFHYRLVGSYMVTLFGVSYQGTYLDASKHGRYRDFLADLYGTAVDAREPVLSEAVFDYGVDRLVTIRRLILPMAETPTAPVNMLLFANAFDAPGLPGKASPLMHLRMDAPFRASTLAAIEERLRCTVAAE